MKLIYWPAGILKQVSEPVGPDEALDQQLVADMKAVMKAHNGAGLSAVQVGVLKRIVVVDSASLGPSVFVNPKIVSHHGDKIPMREGCLSVPGFYEDILRFPEVVVAYQDEAMQAKEERFHGFIAHVLQHELEHLDGKLYLDHLTAARRSAIMGNMQALRRAGKLK